MCGSDPHRLDRRVFVEMLTPLDVARVAGAPDRSRLEALAADGPDASSQVVRGTYIDRMTSAARQQGDSLHLIVMDAHRALNRLQAEVAPASIDGASVYGLTAEDEGLVTAFMAGLHETAALRFDHPGLTTSATRVAERLLIENDLGTTDAHVVVLTIEHLTATVTYTDVHARRLAFFQSMLDSFPVTWSDAERRGGGPMLGEHHVAIGRYEAPDRPALEGYLRHVGSRLRVRSGLESCPQAAHADRRPERRGEPVALGGRPEPRSHGVPGARRRASHLRRRSSVRRRCQPATASRSRTFSAAYATLAVVRFALRAASEGLRAGRSPLLIRDELRVEVLRHAQASHRRLIDTAAEHASLIVESAQAFQAALVRLGMLDGDDFRTRQAARAAGWEHDADEIVVAQRQAAGRVEGGATVAALTTTADDAIDLIEEAVFLLTLVPREAIPVVQRILTPLASIVVMASREHLKAVEIAREVVDGASPDDLEDFIVAVDRVASLEHDADDAERAARAAMIATAPDFRTLYIADNLARAAEAATDALLRAALGLRDHVLTLLSAR